MSSPDPLNLFEESDFTDKNNDSIDEESDSADKDSDSADESRPVTPPRSTRQPEGKYVEDSPGKGNSTQSRSYRSGKLNDMREAVLEGLGGCIPEISFSEFVKNILPPLREDFDVFEIVELLRQSDIFNSSQQALAAFTVEPKNQHAHEDVVFAPLPKICEEICRLALQNAESVVDEEEYFLGMCPNHAPFAEMLMKHRPDGCFLHKSMREFVDLLKGRDGETKRVKKRRCQKINRLKKQGKYFTLYELGAPMEAKKHSSGRTDNVKKIVFHAQQTIAHDPCRRFVIGITIENTDMRLWFFSRGTPVVSEAFDFTRNIEKLAQVDVAECLKWIHGSGWVHRDLSSGNLYFYNERGLIGDLEYARRKDSTTIAHHMRTGSIDYMASEAIQRRYLYTNVCLNVSSHPFFHNDLHDLESLWWVAIYQMFFMLDIKFEPGLSSSAIQLKLVDRRNARKSLFPGTDETENRRSFLNDKKTFHDYISWIPKTLAKINESLGVIRDCLVKSYVELEENFSSEITCGGEQDVFRNGFALCEAAVTQTQRSTGLSLIDKKKFRVFCELRAAANKTEGQFTSNDGFKKPSGKRKGVEGTSDDAKLSRIRR
ncbi:hypothetical protein ACEPAH_3079 [Sanghuangporus vaninii]